MTERVKNLIDRLYLTCDPLEQGCIDCGFEADDLSSEEEMHLYTNIFQCGYCGYWHEVYEETYEPCYGHVCLECHESLMEDEE